jgi:hypothetical protein
MMRVYRVVLKDSVRVIGRKIDASDLTEFGRFNEDVGTGIATLVETLESGHAPRVSNGYALRQVKFNDTKRIEVTVRDYRRWSRAGHLRVLGLIEETVQFKSRFFVPVGQAAQLLAQLLERNTMPAA